MMKRLKSYLSRQSGDPKSTDDEEMKGRYKA